MPTYKPATEQDCLRLAPRLRQADIDELKAGGHTDLLAVLLESYRDSTQRYCIEHDGEPLAIFGAGPLEIDGMPEGITVGSPWMLGSDALYRHRTWFIRHNPEMFALVEPHYDILWNRVYVGNTEHIRWLKWLGFTFGETVAHETTGELFQEFMK